MTILTFGGEANISMPITSPLLTFEKVKDATRATKEGLISQFDDLILTSHFQPIYSIDHQKVIGYEGLIRGKYQNDEPVSPDIIFDKPSDEMASVYLDRLCRYTHIANAKKLADQDAWLFVNVSSMACEKARDYGQFFSDLLNYFNMPAERVVVEIVEDHCTDNAKLLETCNYYKSIGCLIAIDDFGAGHSNFERIWNLQPDIVKLDRSMLLRAINSTHTQEMLSSIVQVLHQAGCLVVMEGIENEAQALIASNANADFVQGFYFSKPQPANIHQANIQPLFDRIMAQTIAKDQAQLHNDLHRSETYRQRFLQVIESVKAGNMINKVLGPLMGLDKVIRCFLVDHHGQQIEESYVVDQDKLNPSGQFYQLQFGQHANWYRKHYVRNALRQPEQLYISAPYQSITGDGLCVTMSMCFDSNEGQKILCVDIAANY